MACAESDLPGAAPGMKSGVYNNCLVVHCIYDAVDVKVAYSCTYELRPYLDLLLQMLLLEDSWQNHRIHNALKGQLNVTSSYWSLFIYISGT